jgi:hypothetical protein
MNIAQRITDLATAIGGKIKQLTTNQGTLSSLTTTAKGSLVAAINEVKTSAGVQINDSAASGTSTYSSTKIQQVADAAALAVKNQLTNGASTLLDTFQEVETAMNANTSAASSLLTAVGNRVRFDSAQTLTAPQMTQACVNIGVGEPDTDFAAAFATAVV